MKWINVNFSADQYTIPLIIFALALFAFMLPPDWQQGLVYHYDLINQGQWWRLVTGHLLHTNLQHLLLNLSALMLLLMLHGKFYHSKQLVVFFIFNAIFISLGLFYFEPSLTQYVGLSGVLHGLFIYGALCDIKGGDKTGWLLLIGAMLKIGHEQIFGASIDIEQLISAHVAINAHLFGAIAGGIFFISVQKMVKKTSD